MFLVYRKTSNWRGIFKLDTLLKNVGLSNDLISPWPMLAFEDNPANQKKRSKSQQRTERGKLNSVEFQNFSKKKHKDRKIKLGYFSSDFRDHPVLYLLMGILREHDRSKFELYGYSMGRGGDGPMREEAKGYFDVSRTFISCQILMWLLWPVSISLMLPLT